MTAAELKDRLEACEQFEAWLARWKGETARTRAARKQELETALRQGRKVRQWCFVQWSVFPTANFTPEGNEPGRLAEHLEHREYGFGLETHID